MRKPCIGIDLGGTGIKGGVVGPQGDVLIERVRRTPVEEGRDGILRELTAMIQELLDDPTSEGAAAAIGIGSAGRIDVSAGTVRYATDNLPGWTGTPLSELMEDRFGLPVYVDNDVNAAAVGEAWLGQDTEESAVSAPVVFIALGTGVGGAVVYEGNIIHGVNGGAGEVGHLLLKPGGHPCSCGQRGCLEQYASGTALNRIAAELSPDWNSRMLLQRCAEGEPRAVAAVRAFAADVAAGLISIRNVIDPAKFILGGGLVDSHEVWWDYVTDSLASMSKHRTIIEKAKLGNRAGMIGAAKLAMTKAAVGH
ncbi:ROK family protein [Paenibacillus sp. GD4]|uniref:ROK family protein n=1 Tax=Paenibacillus sp. GD4 TaxID=3068890 RepID=UPI0027966AE7|nr:ROK family protein [Paenibacillus sp. GD4]MDQ1910266.1 ROK family protein [Paenibacillus sp. GD4]